VCYAADASIPTICTGIVARACRFQPRSHYERKPEQASKYFTTSMKKCEFRSTKIPKTRIARRIGAFGARHYRHLGFVQQDIRE